jgi:predicted Rossmann fold flavoprotein
MKIKPMIIIGGGAAGLCAAITAARSRVNITILEQNSKIGKKILVSGNGQCNITNAHISPERFHSQNPEFIAKILEEYGVESVKNFFDSLGLPLIEGKEGKMFPMSLQASTVTEILKYEAETLGVEIITECEVTAIKKEKENFVLQTSQGNFACEKLLLASGSPAAPQLGGNDSGLQFAESMGHTLIPSHPALTQLVSDEKWVKQASGVKVAGVTKLYANGEYITEKKGDLLFTNYGISGLAILDISREVSTRLANYEYCELNLDLMPELIKEKLTNFLISKINKESQKPIILWLQGVINKKLIHIILEQSKCTAKTELELNRKEIGKLVYAIKNLKLPISDTKSFKGAEVATGGVDTREVNPETMESKLVQNLYFAGEILDVDGDRGGFNFHFAWVSGMRVGNSL